MSRRGDLIIGDLFTGDLSIGDLSIGERSTSVSFPALLSSMLEIEKDLLIGLFSLLCWIPWKFWKSPAGKKVEVDGVYSLIS